MWIRSASNPRPAAIMTPRTRRLENSTPFLEILICFTGFPVIRFSMIPCLRAQTTWATTGFFSSPM